MRLAATRRLRIDWCKRSKAAARRAHKLADPLFDCARLSDRHFQRDPPQLGRTLREFGGDLDGKRCVKFPHHGQRVGGPGQHENGADTAEDRLQQNMRPGEVQGF